MKLHCHRPALAAALQVVGGVVPSRTPKEVLKNVKLQVADGKATLLGTDAEVAVRYEIPGVEIESEGETLLPAARTTAIVRELVEDKVDISVDADAVWIKSDKSEFRLSAQDASEFPPVAEFDDERYYRHPRQIAPRRDQADGLRHRRGKFPLRAGRRAAGTGAGQSDSGRDRHATAGRVRDSLPLARRRATRTTRLR